VNHSVIKLSAKNIEKENFLQVVYRLLTKLNKL